MEYYNDAAQVCFVAEAIAATVLNDAQACVSSTSAKTALREALLLCCMSSTRGIPAMQVVQAGLLAASMLLAKESEL